ncbi:Arc family DNA-binding protein [Paracandidimonas soli]|uniref:Arc family DNA-binding protein n=1 Tax=Paracandidimonas soli TaxID=1917182 RepID=UPI00104928F9|nr:Arc family DNA-binding protein [Paracandidimonas soli]
MKDRHPITPYPIRMPPELRDALEKASAAGNRSLHAEIISRLEQTFMPNSISSEALTQLAADLAEARFREHLHSIKMQNVSEILDELFREIERRELTDELSDAVSGFYDLEKLANTTRTSHQDMWSKHFELQSQMKEALEKLEASTSDAAPKRGLGSKPKTPKK